jgi:hypothetical protein
MAKGDVEIGYRAAEEARRIYKRSSVIERETGISRQTLHEWERGLTPGGNYLAKLYFAGADLVYILTGKRSGQG